MSGPMSKRPASATQQDLVATSQKSEVHHGTRVKKPRRGAGHPTDRAGYSLPSRMRAQPAQFLVPHQIARAEHLALRTNLGFAELLAALQAALGLGAFLVDAENETEFAEAWTETVAINVSMPYEDGTLHAWDPSCPIDCNAGITICVPHGVRETDELVRTIATAMASALHVPIVHHRTRVTGSRDVVCAVPYRPST